jgi:hypothetical protein
MMNPSQTSPYPFSGAFPAGVRPGGTVKPPRLENDGRRRRITDQKKINRLCHSEGDTNDRLSL